MYGEVARAVALACLTTIVAQQPLLRHA